MELLTSRAKIFSRADSFSKEAEAGGDAPLKDRTGHFKGATQGIGVVLTVAS